MALPTETVYGLGANALDAAAVGRIFAAKKRPAWDPIIVHIADEAMLEGLVAEVPEAARKLMKAFWPGPLTLLLPRSAAVPDAVTAGRPLVGVRMPAHPVALELIRRAGVPVAAPSANLFGHISPTSAAHVLDDLDGRIDAVVDGGPTAHGVESTVLDPCQSPMVIYRPGAITAEQIRGVGGAVQVFRSPGEPAEEPKEAMPSPGVGLRHYAPKARLVLVEAPFERLGAAWLRRRKGFQENGWGSCCRRKSGGLSAGGVSTHGAGGPRPKSWRGISTRAYGNWTCEAARRSFARYRRRRELAWQSGTGCGRRRLEKTGNRDQGSGIRKSPVVEFVASEGAAYCYCPTSPSLYMYLIADL